MCWLGSGAVGEVGEVAEHIDRSVSRAENFQRTFMIQRALKHGQPPIVAPGRHLVKEGVLHKVSFCKFIFFILYMFTYILASEFFTAVFAQYTNLHWVYCCIRKILNHYRLQETGHLQFYW